MITKDLILSVASLADAPTGDKVLDRLYENYDTRGSGRHDEPVYYRFLHRLARRLGNATMIELGVRDGGASLHFLKGGGIYAALVDLSHKYDRHLFCGYKWLMAEGSSVDGRMVASVSRYLPAADILFIDTDHTYETTALEFELWRPHVKPGGVILFDDIAAPEYGCGRFFRELKGDKLEMPYLHPMDWGFGIYFVQ